MKQSRPVINATEAQNARVGSKQSPHCLELASTWHILQQVGQLLFPHSDPKHSICQFQRTEWDNHTDLEMIGIYIQ